MNQDLNSLDKSVSQGGGGGRMAADERRSQLLKTAVRLFSQHGFRGTTTREIAQAAGVSEAMVFRHFATKQDLYAAIIDYKACNNEIQNMRERLSELVKAKDDFGVFYNLALGVLTHHEDDLEFMRLLLHSALEGHELAKMFFERYIVGHYEFLSSYIEERQKDQVFRIAEPRIFVRAFFGMLIHHSLNNNLWDREGKLLKISNEMAARSFTDILLRGVMIKG